MPESLIALRHYIADRAFIQFRVNKTEFFGQDLVKDNPADGSGNNLLSRNQLLFFQVKETINPEYESARIIAQKLPLPGIQSLFAITDSLKIIELFLPSNFQGRKISPVNFRKETHLKIVALKRNHRVIYSSASAAENDDKIEIELKESDTIILAGEMKDIKRFLNG